MSDELKSWGSHHYTPENLRAIVRDLRAVEEGTEFPEWINRDHRTHCGILWRVISALMHDTAVPELLAALEFVANAYEASPPNDRTMGFYEARNMARAAIAKATGEQQ